MSSFRDVPAKKSTLLAAFGLAGLQTVTEPGRRIVAEESAGRGLALPWDDSAAFACRAVDMAMQDRAGVRDALGCIFFNRGLIETLAGSARFHQRSS